MRVILEHPAGGTYLGVAKGWLRQLKAQRLDLRLTLMDKLIVVGGFRIFVRAAEIGDLIWIRGGATRHIITANAAGEIFVYDYISGTLTQTNTVDFSVDTLQQFFSKQNHFNGLFSATDGEGSVEIDDLGVQFARSLQYEREFLRLDNGIYTRGLADGGLLADVVLDGATWSELEATLAGDFLSFPLEVTGDQWNFYSGTPFLGIPFVSRKAQELFKWIPSIFYALPNTPDFPPGWYYGQRGGWLGAPNVSELTIDLITQMTTKNPEASNPFGYCERMTSVDSVADGTLNFFLSALPPTEPTDFATYKSTTDFIYGGTLLLGYERTFSTNPYPGEEASADWWNFAQWVDPTLGDAPEEASGIVVYSGQKATVYRYTGILTSVASVENYHSHSVNTLGDKVALFGAADGVIDTVTIIDLSGERFTDSDGVITGPVFILRDAGNIEPTTADLGEWIPAVKIKTLVDGEEEVTPTLPYELDDGTTISYDFDSGGMGSLAVMSYPETGNGVVNFHNIMVSGTRAIISDTVDECFETELIADPTYSGDQINHVEGRGTIAGTYSGEKGSVKFTAKGSGTAIERRTPTISADITTGEVFTSDFMGQIISGSGWDIDTGYLDSLECSVTISATDSCGQTATSDVDAGESPLTLSVGYSGSTPSALNAAGGVTPYSYSISCGSVDSETGVIGDTSMCCGGITGTVEDACGTIVSVDIRAADGRWVEDGSKSKDWRGDCSFGPGANIGCDEISGLVKISWTMHTSVSCPDPLIPSCGIYEAIAYRWFDWVC